MKPTNNGSVSMLTNLFSFIGIFVRVIFKSQFSVSLFQFILWCTRFDTQDVVVFRFLHHLPCSKLPKKYDIGMDPYINLQEIKRLNKSGLSGRDNCQHTSQSNATLTNGHDCVHSNALLGSTWLAQNRFQATKRRTNLLTLLCSLTLR